MMKTYEVEIKERDELKACADNSRVILLFDNREEYHGVFRGFDGVNILLKSESSSNMIGLPFNRLKYWALKLESK